MPEECLLAVDVGGTTTRVALMDGLRIKAREDVPTQAAEGPESLIQRITILCASLGATATRVGVACTGRVHDGLVTAVNQTTMPGWTAIPLQQELQLYLKRPVYVLNDAKAATLAEWHAWNDVARGVTAENFMFVTVSTGIGSGLVLGGQLHQGNQGQDVGLGFTLSDGRILEEQASGRALELQLLQTDYVSVRKLFDAAEQGAPEAQQLLQRPLQRLSQRLQDTHAVLGLDAIVLGGSLGLRHATLQAVRTGFDSLPAGQMAPQVQHAVYGADAGLIGAALWTRRARSAGQENS